MQTFDIAVLKGDGIGPEIVDAALFVLKAVEEKFNLKFNLTEALLGGAAIDSVGNPCPEETLMVCKNSDAVLMGSVGGFKWDNIPVEIRPEVGLLKLRSELNLFANLRPINTFSVLGDVSPIKSEIVGENLDILIVRELTGGIYFGTRGRATDGKSAFDTEEYSVEEITRIAHVAFKSAMVRGKKVTSIDKANVLESSRLWRETMIEVAKEYPEIELNHMYVDNAAMQLVQNPRQFDVIVTSNIFGDILSDLASQITGSIGMLPSASLSYENFGVYEPIHGSAPDIAGKDVANPIATILSMALMLEMSLNLPECASAVREAVEKCLKTTRTADVSCENLPKVGCKEIGKIVTDFI